MKNKINLNLNTKYSWSDIELFFNKYKRKRQLKNFMGTLLFLGLALCTISFVVWILGFIIIHGLTSFKFKMITTKYNPVDLANTGTTGIAGPIVSTILLVFITVAIAIPIGVATSIFMSEFMKKKSFLKKLFLSFINICNGIPSIIFAMFGLIIFVYALRIGRLGPTILSAAFTLSLVVLPTLTLGSYESLLKIDNSLRLNSFALGASKTQTIIRVVLPAATAGIIGTLILTISRSVGESAPVLFTIGGSNAIPKSALDSGNSLTLLLYNALLNPNSHSKEFIYAVAFVIIILIAMINILLRIGLVFMDSKKNNRSFFKNILNMKMYGHQSIIRWKKRQDNFIWIVKNVFKIKKGAKENIV